VTKEYDGDYELEEAFPTIEVGFPGQGVFKSDDRWGLEAFIPEFGFIAEAFNNDIKRNSSLWKLPSELIFWTTFHASCTEYARRESGLDERDDSGDNTPAVETAYHKYAVECLLRLLAPGPATFRNHVLTFGQKEMKFFLERESNPGVLGVFLGKDRILSNGTEAILSTMLTTTYAAVETLAADLWVAALNRHRVLATVYMSKNKERTIDWDRLVKHGLDLRKTMGTILYDTNKTTFQSFGDIKNAYTGAFGSEIDAIFADTTLVFHAEQIRHLFAHRGGVVDEKFRKKMRSCTDFDRAEVGDYIKLDGPIVRKYSEGCLEFASKLFNFVDNWSVEREKLEEAI
jgi:hypothetical protein